MPYSTVRRWVLHGRAAQVGVKFSAKTLELNDAELSTVATACRAMAYQEGERAKKVKNPTMRGPLEANAKRFAVLAEYKGVPLPDST
jgi:hypothetical protein